MAEARPRPLDRQVRDLICEVFAADHAALRDDDVDIRDLAGWDSLQHMEFVVRLEMLLETELSADDISELTHLSSIDAVVKRTQER